ncbi:MAG: tRNA (5-methylaminomethyl-2-thiouridine)(34)-methyltransferase MnmD [Muribaculaceae bacterium]|nr:tRNA (5-methylaminomethyl-2-thiouridine)(34)-methyltransferase MnmD [Muribaculaceae bacterium]
MKIEIERTADGSPTLYREDLDEHYHSVKGALAESRHIYVDLGWRKAAERCGAINLFEVGFGTGLNAVLTAQAALDARIHTNYFSVELYPLPQHTNDTLLSYQPEEYRALFKDINNAQWNKPVSINPFFTLIKIQENLLTMDIPGNLDVVYFDAFAPEKQPEMWDESVFRKFYDSMHPGAILTTYCAKGVIRRMLQQTGFITERLPGPPAGKREVLRAIKP